MTRAELLKIAKPILFNTEMVTAILEGRKTVTRRLVKPQQVIGLGCDKCPNNMPEEYIKQKEMLFKPWCDMSDNELISAIYKPPYQLGDILYVRETWGKIKNGIEEKYVYRTDGRYPTLGDGCFMNFKWKPSIHMPKEAVRIFLKVKDVRVERLQDITPKEIEKEGLANPCKECYAKKDTCEDCICQDEYIDKMIWSELWNSTINKSDLELYGWDANPWVWVIEFERIETEGE